MAITVVDSKLENNISEINEQQFKFGAIGDVVIIETTAYKWTTVAVLPGGIGSITVEGSFDKSTWTSLNCYQNTAMNYLTSYSSISSGAYICHNAMFDYVRIRATSVTVPFDVLIIQDKNQQGLININMVQSGALQGANGASLAPLIVAGIDTTGNIVRTLKTDTSGFLQTQLVNNIFYNEAITALGISATFTGTARDVGVAAGSVMGKASYNCIAFADQAGTVKIQMSNDSITWRDATATTAVSANTPVILSIPVMTRYHRVIYVNGAVAQTAFMINSSYTDN